MKYLADKICDQIRLNFVNIKGEKGEFYIDMERIISVETVQLKICLSK
jgi:hypothetical protein